MAARGKAKRGVGAGVWMRRFGLMAIGLAAGLAGGYAWRSYAPLALPFESPLVADKNSREVESASLRDLAATANKRAEVAERERDQLKARLEKVQQDQTQAERDLADLKIKSMIRNGND